MSVAPIPPPFDQLGHTPFSFYPPIVNIEHNEWVFRRATWSEVQVMNTRNSSELWVPRRFLGEVSLVAEPVMIVGLVKELEYKAGAVYPHVRRVIEMPRAVNDSARHYARTPEPDGPAAVVGIRLESGLKSRAGRLMFGTFAAGILACVAVVIVFRDGPLGGRSRFTTAMDIGLPFTARDNYASIVSRLGPPGDDRWQSDFRHLWYPQQSLTIVLTHAGYLGAIDSQGHVIHSVVLPDGRNSAGLLKNLR